MRLILVRHGESRSNAHPTAAALPGEEGDRLTEEGWRQARRVADSLAGWGVTELVTSPMRRARETASALEERLGMTARVEPLIHEIREAVDFGELSPEEQKLTRWSERMSAHGDDPDYAPEGAESFNDVRGRVRGFQAKLAAGPNEGRLALAVTHGIFSRFFFIEALLGDGFTAGEAHLLWNLRTVNCGVSVFEHGEPRHPADPPLDGWVCSTWMARPWIRGGAQNSL